MTVINIAMIVINVIVNMTVIVIINTFKSV